ncbi:MAG: ATPase [Pseudomonadota bacterium]
MLYNSAQDWHAASQKRVLLFGMSGLGKTHVSKLLRASGEWFHYSIDYRIGTRYLGEVIIDNAKKEAMRVPFLRELLLTDSIYIGSNIAFENLAPLSTYLGKPGDPGKGGLSIAEYCKRQEQHHKAERAALLDTSHFIARAKEIYGYDNFICDSGGSICEVVDPSDPNDPILENLAQHTLMVWIEGTEAHTAELVRRFDKSPKPMCYQSAFLEEQWSAFLSAHKCSEAEVDPDAFVRWTFANAMAHRRPRYAGMAKWGVQVTADEVAAVRSSEDFSTLIATAIERKANA